MTCTGKERETRKVGVHFGLRHRNGFSRDRERNGSINEACDRSQFYPSAAEDPGWEGRIFLWVV